MRARRVWECGACDSVSPSAHDVCPECGGNQMWERFMPVPPDFRSDTVWWLEQNDNRLMGGRDTWNT